MSRSAQIKERQSFHQRNMDLLAASRARVEEDRSQLEWNMEGLDSKILDLEIRVGECPGESEGEKRWLKQMEIRLEGMNLQLGWTGRRLNRIARTIAGHDLQLTWHQSKLRAVNKLAQETEETVRQTVALMSDHSLSVSGHRKRKNPKQVERSNEDYRLRSGFDRPGERIDKGGSKKGSRGKKSKQAA